MPHVSHQASHAILIHKKIHHIDDFTLKILRVGTSA
jgi:hypothetical protein